MKVVGKHVFTFNEQDNGGEALTLVTKLVPNGDPGVILLEQELSLQSYGNCASFTLSGAPMTPELLRELANQLEVKINEAKVKVGQLA